MKKLLALGLAVLLGCGPRVDTLQLTVRDPSGKIQRAPVNAARYEAAQRELSELLGHPLAMQIDAGLLPNDLASFTEEYSRMVETLVGSLRALKRDAPDAFAQVGTHLARVDVRYDATLEQASGALEGTTLEVRTPAGSYNRDLGTAMHEALVHAYRGDEGARLFAMDPSAVPAARTEAYVDAQVHYSSYDRERSVAPAWDPRGALTRDDARGRSLQKLIAFYPRTDGALHERLGKHIVDEGGYYILGAFEARTRAFAEQAPRYAPLSRSREAYVGFLQRELRGLPESQQVRVARQLFPGADDDSARLAFRGFDRLGWALELAQATFTRTAQSAVDGVRDAVVCPYRENERGELDRSSGCSAGFYGAALADEGSRKRLATFLAKADPRATQSAFANLQSSKNLAVFTLFAELEPHASARTAAGRVLADRYGREPEWREPVRKEGYALYGRRAEARGLALYMILATDPYGGMSSITAGIAPPIGAGDIRAMLAVGPRAMTFLAQGWSALEFPKASLVTPHLRGTTATDTLLSLARAACEEGRPAELNALRTAMENAARTSQVDRARYDGAIELIRPNACPPKR